MKRAFVVIMFLAVFVSGCASTPEMIANDAREDCQKYKKTSVALSRFESAVLRPLKIEEDIQVDEDKLAKAKELDKKIELQLDALLKKWPSKNPDHGKLIIQPEVVHLRIISPTTRMLAGLMAGQSSVSVQLHLLDSASGETVAVQEITKVTLASGGEGVTDKNILDYIANISHQYLLANM